MKRNVLLWIAAAAALGTVYTGFRYYQKIFRANTVAGKGAVYVNIPTGSDFNDVAELLEKQGILADRKSFEWVAARMKYTDRVLPGRYAIQDGMSNKDLVILLRSGQQEPVSLIINNIRLKEQLAERVSAVIEADSSSLMALLTNNGYLGQMGLDTLTCLTVFIPNTYELYWNTSAVQFMERMHKEYQAFWSGSRNEKAAKAGLSRQQVSVLASIVEQETRQHDEKPLIAGVYMNRYRKGWRLEADPTLVYALGDFTVRRVLSRFKEIDSPFNTYKYAGLPPGPICLPSISSIDAVLNYADHGYMYFCARSDFSGYHVFAKSYAEHLSNARRFHRELNKRNISS